MGHSPKKYEFINALRSWAFLGVFASHLVQYCPRISGPLRSFFKFGDSGVQLFFMASALTLFLSMSAREGGERRPLLNFFLRRYFRIAPLFYFGAAFYALTFPGHCFQPRIAGELTPGAVVSTLTFTHGFGPYWINTVVPGGWSIAVEMTFYLFVPLLFARLKGLESALRLTLLMHLVGIVLTVAARPILTRLGVDVADRDVFLDRWIFNQTGAFGAGIALYYVIRSRLRAANLEVVDGSAARNSAWLLIGSAYLAAAVVLSDFHLFLLSLLTNLALFLFALALSLYPWRLLVNRPINWIGTHSFSAYITHFAALSWASRFIHVPGGWMIQFAALGVAAIAMTLAMSALTYRFIEVPGQAIGRRLIARLEAVGLSLATAS